MSAKTKIQRNVFKEFKTTKVTFSEVTFIEGAPQMSESQVVELNGGLTNAECITALVNMGKENPVVLATEIIKTRYVMSVEDFIANAKLVTDTRPEETEE